MTEDQSPPQNGEGSDPAVRPVRQTAFARAAARALEPLPPPLRLVVVLLICVALVIAPLLLLVWTR